MDRWFAPRAALAGGPEEHARRHRITAAYKRAAIAMLYNTHGGADQGAAMRALRTAHLAALDAVDCETDREPLPPADSPA